MLKLRSFEYIMIFDWGACKSVRTFGLTIEMYQRSEEISIRRISQWQRCTLMFRADSAQHPKLECLYTCVYLEKSLVTYSEKWFDIKLQFNVLSLSLPFARALKSKCVSNFSMCSLQLHVGKTSVCAYSCDTTLFFFISLFLS